LDLNQYECVAQGGCLQITFSSRYENIEKAIADTLKMLDVHRTPINKFDLSIALHEVLSNAIRHGNKEDIEKEVNFKVWVSDARLQIHVKDEGPGYDPTGHLKLKANELTPHGRGLYIVSSLGFDIEYKKESNVVCLKKTFTN